MGERMLMAEKRIELARIKELKHLEINLQLKLIPDEAIDNYSSGQPPNLRGNAVAAGKTNYHHNASVRVNSVAANVRTKPL